MIQPEFNFDAFDIPKPTRLQSALGTCAFAAGATAQIAKSIGKGAYNLTADVARYASNNPGEAAMFFFAVATIEALEDIEEAL